MPIAEPQPNLSKISARRAQLQIKTSVFNLPIAEPQPNLSKISARRAQLQIKTQFLICLLPRNVPISFLKNNGLIMPHDTKKNAIFVHTRGAFGVARFDKQGNTRAFRSWNEQSA